MANATLGEDVTSAEVVESVGDGGALTLEGSEALGSLRISLHPSGDDVINSMLPQKIGTMRMVSEPRAAYTEMFLWVSSVKQWQDVNSRASV